MTVKAVKSKTTPAAQATSRPATRKPAARKPAVAKAAITVKKPATKAPVKLSAKEPAAVAVKVKKVKKEKKTGNKIKVVRDSFTMPQNEYAKIAELKQLCLQSGQHVKKSELLRAGLQALSKLSLTQLTLALSGLDAIKTGRPKKV